MGQGRLGHLEPCIPGFVFREERAEGAVAPVVDTGLREHRPWRKCRSLLRPSGLGRLGSPLVEMPTTTDRDSRFLAFLVVAGGQPMEPIARRANNGVAECQHEGCQTLADGEHGGRLTSEKR